VYVDRNSQMKDTTTHDLSLPTDNQHIHALLSLFSVVSANDIQQLTQTFSFVLSEQLHIPRFALFLKKNNHEWNLIVKKGIKGCQIDIQQECTKFKQTTLIADSTSPTLSKFDWIIPITHQKHDLAYLLIKQHASTHNQQLLHILHTLGKLLVVNIENQRLTTQQWNQQRIHEELKVAREMQKLLFPTHLPSNNRIDIAAKYIPKYEVGGDYYDFIPLGNDEFFMCMGDVSGKGIGAALLMANFQATLRALFLYQNYDLKFIAQQLNKKVAESAGGEKFITCFLAHLNIRTRTINYVNAGHNHPILTNGKHIEMLKKGSVGLGIFEELPFIEVGSAIVEANTCIFSYTDGVVELENKDGVQFGLDRLIQTIHKDYEQSMEKLNQLIFEKMNQWRGDCPLIDDTALLACRIF